MTLELKRDLLEPDRYEYMSREDSALFDSVKDSDDPKDVIIQTLLMRMAENSRNAHCNSSY